MALLGHTATAIPHYHWQWSKLTMVMSTADVGLGHQSSAWRLAADHHLAWFSYMVQLPVCFSDD